MRSLSKEDVIDLGSGILREIEETFKLVFPFFSGAISGMENLPPRTPARQLFLAKEELSLSLPHQEIPNRIPKTIEDLFNQVHLDSQSSEAQLIRSVYRASLQPVSQAQAFRQIIFCGPPGTGKTLTASLMGSLLAGTMENLERVQFHPSFSYEDFVGGVRPVFLASGKSQVFRFEPGVFKRLCDRAQMKPNENFVILIDEINRGNVPAIFGELMWALEYRGQPVALPFSEAGRSIQLTVPPNVFVLGTMNTADRSIALMDFALRRRFKFISIQPRVEVLDEFLQGADEGLKAKVKRLFLLLNGKLSEVNPDFCVGHSYFQPWPGETFTQDTLERIWELMIMPLIQEYFYTESRAKNYSLKILTRELLHSHREFN